MKTMTRVRNGKRCEIVYMLCSNDKFELPVLVSENLKEIADYIGTTTGVCASNLSRKKPTIGRAGKLKLEKVYLPIDSRRSKNA